MENPLVPRDLHYAPTCILTWCIIEWSMLYGFVRLRQIRKEMYSSLLDKSYLYAMSLLSSVVYKVTSGCKFENYYEPNMSILNVIYQNRQRTKSVFIPTLLISTTLIKSRKKDIYNNLITNFLICLLSGRPT